MSYGGFDSQQPYNFGWLDELVDIHFPKKNKIPKHASEPWWFYITRQTPTYFQFIAEVNFFDGTPPGHGWQCTTNLPIIKILAIDTQPVVPTTEIGFNSIEEVIGKVNAGAPVSSDAWGRFNFKSNFFWKVLPPPVAPGSPTISWPAPTWASFANGLPQNPTNDGHRAIDDYIRDATHLWVDTWNKDAVEFNAATAGVNNSGYAIVGPGSFALPSPGGSGYVATIPFLQQNVGKYYFGAIPPTAVFERGSPFLFKQSFAFNFAVAQLDAERWDMSVFPPRDTLLKPGDPGFRLVHGVDRKASAFTGMFGGYANPAIFPPFPQNEPIIT